MINHKRPIICSYHHPWASGWCLQTQMLRCKYWAVGQLAHGCDPPLQKCGWHFGTSARNLANIAKHQDEYKHCFSLVVYAKYSWEVIMGNNKPAQSKKLKLQIKIRYRLLMIAEADVFATTWFFPSLTQLSVCRVAGREHPQRFTLINLTGSLWWFLWLILWFKKITNR